MRGGKGMLDVSRKELKYIISPIEMNMLKKRLKHIMQNDSHNGINGYVVRSLYFDTLSDSDFEDKVEGYDKRQKIRLRIYDTKTDNVKLELKEKDGMYQRKRSLSITRHEAEEMIKGNYKVLLAYDNPLANWLYTYMVSRCYRPKCIVEYNRYAYILDYNETRITFDQKLRASEASFDIFSENLMLYPVTSSNEITLEVKFDGFIMSMIKNELSLINRMQTSNSKYCKARMISKRGRK